MTKSTNAKNRTTKLNAIVAKAKQELLPPQIHEAGLSAPASLETVKDIREEMARIYKMVFKGKIMLSDATRLAYYLDRMIQAIRAETELDAIAKAYAKAWGGINIITSGNSSGGDGNDRNNEEVIDGNYTRQ